MGKREGIEGGVIHREKKKKVKQVKRKQLQSKWNTEMGGKKGSKIEIVDVMVSCTYSGRFMYKCHSYKVNKDTMLKCFSESLEVSRNI